MTGPALTPRPPRHGVIPGRSGETIGTARYDWLALLRRCLKRALAPSTDTTYRGGGSGTQPIGTVNPQPPRPTPRPPATTPRATPIKDTRPVWPDLYGDEVAAVSVANYQPSAADLADPDQEWIAVTTFGESEPSYVRGRR